MLWEQSSYPILISIVSQKSERVATPETSVDLIRELVNTWMKKILIKYSTHCLAQRNILNEWKSLIKNKNIYKIKTK